MAGANLQRGGGGGELVSSSVLVSSRYLQRGGGGGELLAECVEQLLLRRAEQPRHLVRVRVRVRGRG